MSVCATCGQQQKHAQILDDFVATLGFVGLGEAWREIDRAKAQTVARIVLQRDLAYDSAIMSEPRAHELAAQFLELFENSTRYFTNGEFTQRGLSSWSAITDATFDTGIIGIDSQYLGILWVQDED